MNVDYFFRKILWRLGITLFLCPFFFRAEGAGLIIVLFAALPLAIIWAGPVSNWMGHLSSRIYWPSDSSIECRPQYSIAESRIREGRFEEAIEAFRGYALQYPDEIIPHLRIAELQLERFGNAEGAITELKVAIPKARGVDAYSFVHQRLADLHFQHRKDNASALECLKEIQRRFPGTRQAKTALERAQRLTKKE